MGKKWIINYNYIIIAFDAFLIHLLLFFRQKKRKERRDKTKACNMSSVYKNVITYKTHYTSKDILLVAHFLAITFSNDCQFSSLFAVFLHLFEASYIM